MQMSIKILSFTLGHIHALAASQIWLQSVFVLLGQMQIRFWLSSSPEGGINERLKPQKMNFAIQQLSHNNTSEACLN